ncbi:MAG: nuclear transport factor 2 family protein [Steroidobacterales bacterium]
MADAMAGDPVLTASPLQRSELLRSADATLARNKQLIYNAWRRDHDASTLVTLIAEGDAVVVAALDRTPDPKNADVHFEAVHFDYYRVADGKVVQHESTPRFTLEQILDALEHPLPNALPDPGTGAPAAVPIEQQAARLLDGANPKLAANKRVVFDFFRIALVSGRLDVTPQYATESYIQHNPTVPTGRTALIKTFEKIIKPQPTLSPGVPGVVRVLAERDQVVLVQQRVAGGSGVPTWMFDMFRVQDGKVAEHWDSPREAAEVGAARTSEPGKLYPAALAESTLVASSVPAVGSTSRQALQGTWLIEQPVYTAKTVDGQLPPLTSDGQTLYQQHLDARRAGDATFDDTAWCGSAGIPRLMLMDYPFQIVLQPNDTIFFYYEWNRWQRLIYMTHDKVSPIGTSSMGSAAGHWEGDSLVILSNGFREDSLIDGAGLPHSDKLQVTERLHLIAPDVLEDRIRIEDPAYYTQPWDMRASYRRRPVHTTLPEDVCLDRAADGPPADKPRAH